MTKRQLEHNLSLAYNNMFKPLFEIFLFQGIINLRDVSKIQVT